MEGETHLQKMSFDGGTKENVESCPSLGKKRLKVARSCNHFVYENVKSCLFSVYVILYFDIKTLRVVR